MKKNIFFCLLMLSCTVSGAEIATSQAVLRGVDKVTGRVSTMKAPVGTHINFGNLTIAVERCYTRPPEETPENSAFLTVTEKMPDNSEKEVFIGWMFSSNPALSAMEHPVYDVWVIGCKNDDTAPIKTLSETVEEGKMVSSDKPVAEEDMTANAQD